jgi:plastocyanin
MRSFVARRALAAAAGVLLTLGAAGAFAEQQAAQQQPAAQQPVPQHVAAANEAEISIQSFQFVPAILTVKAGTAVTWINHDEEPHNVVSPDRVFRSTAIDSNEKFTAVFDKPGTYNYICAMHPHMHGTILVQ